MKARGSIKNKDDLKYSERVSPFYKSHEGNINIFISKIKNLSYAAFKKAAITLMLFAVFAWFNIHNTSFVKGVGALVSGDLSGLSLVFDYQSNKETLKEAWQVGVGTDYSWLDYSKEKGIDLHGKFTYIGKHKSIMKDAVTINDVVEDCQHECDKIATAATVEEAEEFCYDNYGARVPSRGEYEKIIGSINPVVDPKINKRTAYPEWTNNVHPKDGDDYYVYFKSKKKPESFINQSYEGKGEYLDEDSDYIVNIGFRCIIELPY